MRVEGVPNIYLPNNQLNLKGLKPVQAKGTDVPKPQKGIYVYSGPGEYYTKPDKNYITEFLSKLRNLPVREVEWKEITIKSLDGRTFTMKYSSSMNLKMDHLLEDHQVDVQI